MVKRPVLAKRPYDLLKAAAVLLSFVAGAYVTASVVGAIFGSGLVAFAIAFANGLLLAVLSQLALRIDPACRGIALDQAGTSHWDSILSNHPSTRVRACQPRAPPAASV